MNNKQGQLQKARQYAFLLLKFRQRSEKEIYRRLKNKKFSEEIIKETLCFLKNKDFINDELFAVSWIESRIKKPYGLRKIKQELQLKGINKEIIDRSISEVKDKYSEDRVVLEIAKERLIRLKGIERDSAKRRVFSFLLRRGFSPETVIDTLNQLCTPSFLRARGDT